MIANLIAGEAKLEALMWRFGAMFAYDVFSEVIPRLEATLPLLKAEDCFRDCFRMEWEAIEERFPHGEISANTMRRYRYLWCVKIRRSMWTLRNNPRALVSHIKARV
jgi:hypothetical protein